MSAVGKISVVKVLSGLGCAIAVLVVLSIDYATKTAYATSIFILILAVGSSFEFCNMLMRKGISISRPLLVTATTALVLAASPILGGEDGLFVVLPMLCSLVLVSAYLIILSGKARADAGIDVAFTFTGFLHLGVGFSFFCVLSTLHPGSATEPYIGWTALFIFVVKANDILGYLLGSVFGRSRLHPISPNKSVEGSLFGLFGGTAISLLTWYLFGLYGFGVLKALSFGLVIGALAQTGDLAESLLKRYCRVKDSGSIMPASGGFFDFADCFLLAAPAAYILLRCTVGGRFCISCT